ncbi:MAG: hypothetical protein LBP60_00700 [Spirochaetaceae bacterium]|jgi:hypothetical protein|nr:hypothetical protein [Spirochaetaceae bacterium]
MQIHDASITRLIEHIGEHYRTNISNRFIRPALLQLPFDNQSWDLMEDLTEKVPSQTLHLDELYREIVAAAHFAAVVRRELVPSLRNRISRDPSSPDKVLRDMAVNNFASNLQVFADLVNELFVKLVEADKADAKGHVPLYTTMPELANVGRLLVGG